MRKFFGMLMTAWVILVMVSPLTFSVFAQGASNPTSNTPAQPAASTATPNPAPTPGPTNTPATATGTSTGIPVGDNGLPSNLPRLKMQGVTDPVKVTESFMLNYVISPIFYLSGGVAIIMIMYSGFRIITARGEEDSLTSAKTTLIWAFVGLGLVMLAYTIVRNLAAIILQLV